MDHQGQLRRAALASGIPDDEVTRFTDHLRLSVRLAGDPGGVPVGQYGGLPRLPVGAEWPSDGVNRLPFIFSVDCAALPRADGSTLPADGSLLFFLDHERDHIDGDTGNYAEIVYVPAGTGTVVADDAGSVDEPYGISASLVAELPEWFEPGEDDDEDDLSPFQQQLAEDLPHLEKLRALAEELWPPGTGLASAYLGGHVDDEVITHIAEQILAGGETDIPVAKWYSHVEREKHRQAAEWMTLARFSADDEFYTGSFVIRHDDLAAGRLDRAFSVTGFSE